MPEAISQQVAPRTLASPADNTETILGSVSTRKRRRRSVRVDLGTYWAGFMRRIGTTTVPSSSSHGEKIAESNVTRQIIIEPNEPVDEIVVDRIWTEEIKMSPCHSEKGTTPEKSGESRQNATSIDRESIITHKGFWSSFSILIIIRWRIWPHTKKFFSSRFPDEKYELHYAQENWFVRKVG